MLSSASGFRRTGAGLALIIAPLLFLVADVLSPAWSDDSAEYFAEVADNPGAQSASGLLFTVGMALMVVGAIGIANCIRGRGVVLANIGVALAVLGLGVFPALTATSIVDAVAVDVISQADYVALLEAGEDDAGFIILIALALIPAVISLVLLALAAGRSGLAPWWVAGVLIASTVLIVAGSAEQGLAIGTDVLQLVGFGFIGVRLLGMSNAEWESPPPDWRAPAPA